MQGLRHEYLRNRTIRVVSCGFWFLYEITPRLKRSFLQAQTHGPQTHVSFSSPPVVVPPPKMTTWPRPASNAAPYCPRADGFVAGFSWFHAVPSQIQVSSTYTPPIKPPKRTVLFRTASYASLCVYRGDGAVAGLLATHSDPFHVQVSPKN